MKPLIHNEFYVNRLKRRFDSVLTALVAVIGFGALVSVFWLLPETLEPFRSLAAWGAALTLSIWLYRFVGRIPRHLLDDGRLDGLADRLRSLRATLDEVRGSRPNPFIRTEVRSAATLNAEDVDAMTDPEQTRHIVRQLQASLRAFASVQGADLGTAPRG